jgi:hypothetical protein
MQYGRILTTLPTRAHDLSVVACLLCPSSLDCGVYSAVVVFLSAWRVVSRHYAYFQDSWSTQEAKLIGVSGVAPVATR